METPVLKAEPRKAQGTKVARKLRDSGRLPLIIYGHGQAPECASLDQREMELALTHGARMLELELNGTKQPYLIKDVQYDHLDKKPVHMDLARVDLHERVTVTVAIELRGTPRGVNEGGVLEQMLQEIEVECLVTEIPQTLHPLVADLGVGDALLVRDLVLPSGVTTSQKDDEVVAMVRALVAAEEPEAPSETGEETAMPERIGRVRKEDEDAGKSGD